jgi:hypothetical protein
MKATRIYRKTGNLRAGSRAAKMAEKLPVISPSRAPGDGMNGPWQHCLPATPGSFSEPKHRVNLFVRTDPIW